MDGGPLPYRGAPIVQGVIVGHQTRLGRISQDKFLGYKITDATLTSLRAEGLPDTVLTNLTALKGKVYKDENAATLSRWEAARRYLPSRSDISE